jgi:hypothetical protein
MLNSVISRKGAQFACIDIKKSTSIRQWMIQNTSISKSQIFQKSLFLEYRLAGKEDKNGWIYLEIR